ncbi:hypothetical protein [Actinoallomurus iriomotensis]|uniref:hypothetical protein n=1 Tax=Actinoallomurus iriomotensis TaxID=478107 RepID=UPI002552469F|nr:hypothetical protein [Actinoallomurus iriomotensis]
MIEKLSDCVEQYSKLVRRKAKLNNAALRRVDENDSYHSLAVANAVRLKHSRPHRRPPRPPARCVTRRAERGVEEVSDLDGKKTIGEIGRRRLQRA